jgi:hypothetical protein
MKKTLKLIITLIIILILTSCTNEKSTEVDGIAIFNKDKNYIIDYIPEEKTHLREILGKEINEEVAVITKSGAMNIISYDLFLDKNSESVFTISKDNNKIQNVVGIYTSDYFYSITDTYDDMRNYLDNDEKVMVFLLDGFSFEQYKHVKDHLSFLPQYFIHEALSVYTPVTNAGFAAMITGQTPDINGVHNRSYRDIKVPSIFDYALHNDKKAILLEGDIKILNTEIEPELHLDFNKNGDIDDEVFDTAMKATEEDYDLIFIHFHGIDDRGHSYGPMADETLDYIKKIDTYIEELSKVWDGLMIITADHGMHASDNAGNHGLCLYEDMVVPYFIR